MNSNAFFARLEEDFPLSAQCDWDHSGFAAGRSEKEITRIYVAVDPTVKNIEAAAANRCDLLLTHHPLIFSPCYSVTDLDPVGKRVLALLQNDLSAYAMHTNYDVLRMADLALEKLSVSRSEPLSDEGIGKIGILPSPVSLEELGNRVKDCFSLPQICLYAGSDQPVTKAAIVPGSGKSLLSEARRRGAEVMITGDIGHHDGIDAAGDGLAVIDAGHYGIEHIFIADMGDYLRKTFPDAVVFEEEPELPYRLI